MSKPAIFLDRDGTVIEEKDYLSDPCQVKLFDFTVQALRILQTIGFKLIIVTNQSGVAKGKFDENTVNTVNQVVTNQLKESGVILNGSYFCPHHPEGTVKEYKIVCDCRKPRPGLLLRAASDLEIDLSRSWIIGDKVSDLLTGEDLGVKGILVLTGYGHKEQLYAPSTAIVLKNLFEAAIYIKNKLPYN